MNTNIIKQNFCVQAINKHAPLGTRYQKCWYDKTECT